MKLLTISTFIIMLSLTGFAQQKDQITSLLKKHCVKSFDKCYEEREFLSLRVYEFEELDEYIWVEGTVNHTGVEGENEYTRDFKAKIYVYDKTVKIEFNKKVTFLIGGSHWEKCTKTYEWN